MPVAFDSCSEGLEKYVQTFLFVGRAQSEPQIVGGLKKNNWGKLLHACLFNDLL